MAVGMRLGGSALVEVPEESVARFEANGWVVEKPAKAEKPEKAEQVESGSKRSKAKK